MLYTAGFISYPRTETDQFDEAINLMALIRRQANDTGSWGWGDYAERYRKPHLFTIKLLVTNVSA